MSAVTRLFVYGTLKRGGSNAHHMAGQRFVGVARTAPGYRLFDAGGYPGMVPQDSDRNGVAGEVWEVDTAALSRLDELEGTAEGLYSRAPIALCAPFDRERIETYLYARSIVGRREVGSEWTF